MHEVLVHFGLDKQHILGTLWALAPRFVAALIVILVAAVFYKITAWIFETLLRRTRLEAALVKIIVRSLYRGLVIIVVLVMVLGKLGVNVGAALAGVGVVGLAIGFAAQRTLANIFSGFGIFLDNIYHKGHWIQIAEHYGEVMDITLRTTKIRTLDNSIISVPNSSVSTSPVINYSEQGVLRITVVVRIPYSESVDRVRDVLLEAINSMKGALKRPAPHVVVKELADSGVDLYVRIFIQEAGQEQRYTYALAELCKETLDKAKITIPFPQRDIHIVAGKSAVGKSVVKKKK
jgi:small conductance mechanosensitive channel